MGGELGSVKWCVEVDMILFFVSLLTFVCLCLFVLFLPEATVMEVFNLQQVTPASSVWTQSGGVSLAAHSRRVASLPVQSKSSKRMSPVPSPKYAKLLEIPPAVQLQFSMHWDAVIETKFMPQVFCVYAF